MSDRILPSTDRGDPRTSRAQPHRAIGGFLRELAHELGNIAFPLRLLAELQGRADRGDSPDFRMVLENQVESLQQIVRRVQTVGRCLSSDIQPTFETLCARDIADEAISDLADEVRKRGQQLNLDDSTGGTVHVAGDRQLLELALAELLRNAVKFTPPGGTVALRLKSDREQVEFVVSDSGPGVSEELAGRIFEPFVTGRARLAIGSGELGCGLAVAREVLAVHRGIVELRTSSPGGCEFVMALPRPAPEMN